MRELLAATRRWIEQEPVALQYRAFKLKMLLEKGHVDLVHAVQEWEDLHGKRAG